MYIIPFALVPSPEYGNTHPMHQIFWHNGPYGEAKKAARRHFAGAGTVFVQP